MDQFVVLHHKLPNDHQREDHWDLMLQHQGVLWTWALDELPAQKTVCDGIRLPDHDMKYLEYEGPISGDRGEVSQVISGSYNWLSPPAANSGTAELVFDDNRLIMRIEELSGGKCRFQFE